MMAETIAVLFVLCLVGWGYVPIVLAVIIAIVEKIRGN